MKDRDRLRQPEVITARARVRAGVARGRPILACRGPTCGWSAWPSRMRADCWRGAAVPPQPLAVAGRPRPRSAGAPSRIAGRRPAGGEPKSGAHKRSAKKDHERKRSLSDI